MDVKTYNGPEAKPLIEQLGDLRIKVFREFPYLYEGDMDYEKKYLDTYLSSDDSFIAVVLDGDKAVGASTAILMRAEEEAFKQPFIEKGYNPDEIVYFGESVLLPQYRGKGFGKEFFRLREEFAKSKPGHSMTTFCGVVREPTDPRTPKDYRPLDTFWQAWGYNKVPGLTTSYEWKEVGDEKETTHNMQFWLKNL